MGSKMPKCTCYDGNSKFKLKEVKNHRLQYEVKME